MKLKIWCCLMVINLLLNIILEKIFLEYKGMLTDVFMIIQLVLYLLLFVWCVRKK